jgi:hypothetical protein
MLWVPNHHFAQNSLLGTPCVVAIMKIKPRKRNNSSVSREALVAGMRLNLTKLTGKKWKNYPIIVCNVAWVTTSKGFTPLRPAFLHSSRAISPQAKDSQSSTDEYCLWPVGCFLGQFCMVINAKRHENPASEISTPHVHHH